MSVQKHNYLSNVFKLEYWSINIIFSLITQILLMYSSYEHLKKIAWDNASGLQTNVVQRKISFSTLWKQNESLSENLRFCEISGKIWNLQKIWHDVSFS